MIDADYLTDQDNPFSLCIKIITTKNTFTTMDDFSYDNNKLTIITITRVKFFILYRFGHHFGLLNMPL